ncbi:MAG TPA: hypothetical protein VGI39_01780 [Polyangiaceae bacterium]|jgi:hypothetical protein
MRDRGPKLYEQIIDTCLEKLTALPQSPQVVALRERALVCRRELDAWRSARPALDVRTEMRLRVLKIHAETDALV